MHHYKVLTSPGSAWAGQELDVFADGYEVGMSGDVTFIGRNGESHPFLSIPAGDWRRVNEFETAAKGPAAS
jgi:hypothetical protein